MNQPKDKNEAKPKLTDAERHKRFVETAKEIGASESAEEFDKAFQLIARPAKPIKNPNQSD